MCPYRIPFPCVPTDRSHELVPWSSVPRSSLLPGGGNPLAWSISRDAPLLVSRTFLLPTTVRDISITRSRAGVATPLLLFSTVGGGVLSVAKRALDPRRPTGEPKASEKAEGLVQYTPVLPFSHAALVTYSVSVPRPRILASAHTAFEATSLVVLLGAESELCRLAALHVVTSARLSTPVLPLFAPRPFCAAGLDHFVARLTPGGKAFDQLDPDFNSALFLGMLAVGTVATAVLHRSAKKRELEVAWR